jgi:hypothetical protein
MASTFIQFNQGVPARTLAFLMVTTYIAAGMLAFLFGQIRLPSCIIGAENKNYCVSKQHANIRSEHIEFVKKLNTNPNDARVIIKLKEYGTISVPYDTNKLTIDYHVNF